MKGIIRWFAENGVASNLLMVFIVVAGVLALTTLNSEVLPEFSADQISVTVVYPGAAPEEVEEAIVQRIEDRIQDLVGIEEINSTATENVGTVAVEVASGASVQRLLNDIKARVDAIDSFPEEAEEPVIEEMIIRRQVINVAISGDAEEKTLRAIAERVREDLLSLPGISQVDTAALRPFEISIEVSEEALRRYGLTFDQMAAAVRHASLDLPGGSVDTSGGQVLLRTEGQALTGEAFEALPLMTLADGSRVELAQVATVVDGFAETDQSARFDGEPAALVQVYRVGDQDALGIADRVKDYVREAARWAPEGIQITTWQDDSIILRSRLDLLLRNGRAGLVLVFLVLALFLRLQLAAWVALGIPISFLGAIALMPVFDASVSMISLFAFIVVLGIVVDDAIIVGENVYTEFQQGGRGLPAVTRGAQLVSTPVIFAVLTTVAAFAPLLNIPGTTGKIMRVVPLIVIPTLVFSLIESLLVLPNHLLHVSFEEPKSWLFGAWRRVQLKVSGGLQKMIHDVYRPFLERAIRWRYVTVSTGLATLIITGSLIAAGTIRFTFFPPVEADNVVSLLTMPLGTPAEVTGDAMHRIERAALDLERDLEREHGGEIFAHVLTSIGEQPFRAQQNRITESEVTAAAPHLAEVNVELVPAEQRDLTSPEIAQLWRERAGQIPGAVELVFVSSLFDTGDPIDIRLSGPDVDSLARAATELKEQLGTYAGVRDVADSFRAGKQELHLDVTPEAEAAGLTLAGVARQTRQAFYGEEVQRIQRGRDEIKVMVRLPESDRESMASLEDLRFRTLEGAEIPFSTAVDAELKRGPATIQRTDRQRVVRVSSDLDLEVGNANQILGDLADGFLPALADRYPGLRYAYVGQQQEQRETLGGLFRGFVLALVVIYSLLAIPFKSYMQPAIVMCAIPFGMVGAVWGHLMMGYDLTILSGFGAVALTGVVVNDSLVMVDFINRARAVGASIFDAIREAGTKRFRAILLTSLTTFAGLTPLLLERSLQAQFLIPMALSLAFGILFATVVVLVLVPTLYSILEDLRGREIGVGRRS